MRTRNLEIDTLRGFACILLVSYHVIGSNSSNGLRLSEGIYRELNDFLVFIRMPLFTFISGFVYACRPFSENFNKYITGKARRLILPMLTVGTLFAFLQSIVPGSNSYISHWYLIHIIPVGHFWFLEAVFLIFIIVAILDRLKLIEDFQGFAIVLLISSILYSLNIDFNYLSISGSIYLFPYFILGLAVYRLDFLKIRCNYSRCLLFIFSTILCLIYLDGGVLLEDKHHPVMLLLSAIMCILLFNSDFKVKFLYVIGAYSYSIYLFHVFFTAGTRIVIQKIGVETLFVLFVFPLMLGVLGPIVCEYALSKWQITKRFFLGK